MEQGHKNKLLQELFAHATESIIVIDKSGEIILINPSTEKLFSYTHEELKGKKVEYLLPERVAGKHVGHREGFNKNLRPGQWE